MLVGSTGDDAREPGDMILLEASSSVLQRNGSFNSSVADGLSGAFCKHLLMNLRASSSWIMSKAFGSLPCFGLQCQCFEWIILSPFHSSRVISFSALVFILYSFPILTIYYGVSFFQNECIIMKWLNYCGTKGVVIMCVNRTEVTFL